MFGMPDHLLLVDDDHQLLGLLADYLGEHGYRVSTATHAAEMRRVMDSHKVDLVILDLMLPGEDGLAVCRGLRAVDVAYVPVLILTARGDEVDRVLGLEMGADDYLIKPFATRELLARVRSVLRRTRMMPPLLGGPRKTRHLGIGGWEFDTVTRQLTDRAGTVVVLTASEYRLLMVLIDHRQRVLNREQLLNLIHGSSGDPFDRSIDLLVSRLRHRLRDDPRENRYIRTIRSEGYMFCAEVRQYQDVMS